MSEQSGNPIDASFRETVLAFHHNASAISISDFFDAVSENLLPIRNMYSEYQCAAMEIETKFRVLDSRFSVEHDRNPIEAIKMRLKSPESIIRKMEDRGYPMTMESMLENVRDIAGIRVVCSFVDDIYRLADCLLEQDDITLVQRKDYIQNPKPNGYRSLHLLVQVPIFTETGKKMMFVEVQLRTIAMDFWASLEHKLRYKHAVPEEELAGLTAELESCARASAELDARMQSIRNRLYRT